MRRTRLALAAAASLALMADATAARAGEDEGAPATPAPAAEKPVAEWVPPTSPPTSRPNGEASAPDPNAPVDEGDDAWHRWHLELAAFPMVLEQQIEGPNRDDKLTQDGQLVTALNVSYAPLEWIEPALWLQFDVGSVRRAIYSRPDAQGVATEEQLVEGTFWEFWLALMLRGRLGPGFLEVGYAPLILRDDTIRRDLPNTLGETDGVFEGSRAVAFLVGGGASIPVTDDFDVTLRMQFRIRYLVARGGEPLADGEENGQMALYPFLGAHYHF